MIYIVTGVSRGLGKALVQELLKQNQRVIGIGRSHSFENENFQFIHCDFSDLEKISQLEFDPFHEEVVLINNAAIIGEIKKLSDQKSVDFEKILKINTIAPLHLTLKIYEQMKNKSDFSLINISSGAGNHAIPSWSAYCASKAAMNMWSESFKIEENEKGNHPRVHAVSPGIIDTDMQKTIRSSNQEDFSLVQNFKEYKNNGELFSAEECSNKIIAFIQSDKSENVLIDIRTV